MGWRVLVGRLFRLDGGPQGNEDTILNYVNYVNYVRDQGKAQGQKAQGQDATYEQLYRASQAPAHPDQLRLV